MLFACYLHKDPNQIQNVQHKLPLQSKLHTAKDDWLLEFFPKLIFFRKQVKNSEPPSR